MGHQPKLFVPSLDSQKKNDIAELFADEKITRWTGAEFCIQKTKMAKGGVQ